MDTTAIKRWACTVAVAALIATMPLVACASGGGSSDASNAAQNSAEAGNGQGDTSAADGSDGSADGPSVDGVPSDTRDTAQSVSEKNSSLTFDDIPKEDVISVGDLAAIYTNDDVQVIDTRGLGAYSRGRIPGSLNVPAGRQVEIRFDEFDFSKQVVLVAQASEHLAEVRQTLIDLGGDESKIKVLDGGMDAWTAAGFETVENPETGC